MNDPRRRASPNLAGTLGQPIIDPDVVNRLAPALARATADLEAMRMLSVISKFESTWDGLTYTVVVLGVTKSDPFLSRAILLAAQEAGVAPPATPGKLRGESKP